MDVVLDRSIIYHKRRSGKIDPWMHIGSPDYLESLGIRIDSRIYCMRLEGGKIVLAPAKNQQDPRANRCFRAVLYKIKTGRGTALRMRLSYQFLAKVGLPRTVEVRFVEREIVLEPIDSKQ